MQQGPSSPGASGAGASGAGASGARQQARWDGGIDRDWRARIDAEQWVDAREWAQVHGVGVPLAGRVAWTCALLEAIETPSFGELRSGRADPARRGRYVLTQAGQALERALKRPAAARDRCVFTIDFAAPLRPRAAGPAWRMLRLRAEPGLDGAHDVLIGLPAELASRPAG